MWLFKQMLWKTWGRTSLLCNVIPRRSAAEQVGPPTRSVVTDTHRQAAPWRYFLHRASPCDETKEGAHRGLLHPERRSLFTRSSVLSLLCRSMEASQVDNAGTCDAGCNKTEGLILFLMIFRWQALCLICRSMSSPRKNRNDGQPK